MFDKIAQVQHVVHVICLVVATYRTTNNGARLLNVSMGTVHFDTSVVCNK